MTGNTRPTSATSTDRSSSDTTDSTIHMMARGSATGVVVSRPYVLRCQGVDFLATNHPRRAVGFLYLANGDLTRPIAQRLGGHHPPLVR